VDTGRDAFPPQLRTGVHADRAHQSIQEMLTHPRQFRVHGVPRTLRPRSNSIEIGRACERPIQLLLWLERHKIRRRRCRLAHPRRREKFHPRPAPTPNSPPSGRSAGPLMRKRSAPHLLRELLLFPLFFQPMPARSAIPFTRIALLISRRHFKNSQVQTALAWFRPHLS